MDLQTVLIDKSKLEVGTSIRHRQMILANGKLDRTCQGCKFLVYSKVNLYRCKLAGERWNHGRWRLKWSACGKYQRKDETGNQGSGAGAQN